MQAPDANFDALEFILDGEEAMSPKEALGAFVALFSSPEVLPPSQWLPLVLRDRDLGESLGPAIAALMELYNTIGDGLEREGMFCPPPDEPDSIRSFCAGYVEIMSLSQAWVEQEAELSFILLALIDETVLDDPEVALEIEPEEWLDHARHDLGAVLEELYLNGRGRLPGQGHQAASSKVNRNAPCPCGSGRKYKKCCDAS